MDRRLLEWIVEIAIASKASGREDRLPYDHPNPSKDFLQGHSEPEWMPLRPVEFFTDHDIEALHGSDATRVDSKAKTASFRGDEQLAYDALLSATGGEPRTLLVVVGVGVKPATDFLAGVSLHKDGRVVVDEHLGNTPDQLHLSCGDVLANGGARCKSSGR